MNFRKDYTVYVCPHVFDKSRPVLDSVRDHDGDWQFLCGEESCLETSKPKVVGAGHIVSQDASMAELTILKPGMYAERKDSVSPWQFGWLED